MEKQPVSGNQAGVTRQLQASVRIVFMRIRAGSVLFAVFRPVVRTLVSILRGAQFRFTRCLHIFHDSSLPRRDSWHGRQNHHRHGSGLHFTRFWRRRERYQGLGRRHIWISGHAYSFTDWMQWEPAWKAVQTTRAAGANPGSWLRPFRHVHRTADQAPGAFPAPHCQCRAKNAEQP